MKLNQLFSFFESLEALAEQNAIFQQEVTGICFNADLVIDNSVFVAIKGEKNDGHHYLEKAIAKGAIALVVENKGSIPADYPHFVLEVPDTRQILDILAARFYNYPSHELFCFGVTGTNGKTSITYLLEHILNENGKLTGVMGTVNHRLGFKKWNSEMTTPDPVLLQKRLREFKDEGAKCAAIEVSSHALEQKRAHSVHFNTAIFTNLTLDHLDYHQSMQKYFEAKQKLFTDLMWLTSKMPKFAVINIDDKYGRRLKVAEDVIAWTYGQNESDFQFKINKMNFSETEFEIKTAIESIKATVPCGGEFYIYNVVASCAAALSLGISLEQSLKSLKNFYGVPGRLQRVSAEDKKSVFVDYAHTPDALQNVLQSLNKIKKQSSLNSRIITVFGCGGDRDKTKRPLMGKIACELSDQVFVTSDNPRTESPEQIISDIEVGLNEFKNYKKIIDREEAIGQAIEFAKAGDVVLIAGKGHEDYQIVGTEKKYFDDAVVAQTFLKK